MSSTIYHPHFFYNYFTYKLKSILIKIPFLKQLYQSIKKMFPTLGFIYRKPFPTKPYIFTRKDAQNVYNIVLSGNLHYTSGEEVRLFESEFAAYHGTKYALATNAGTSALELAIKAIAIQPGDEVIVPAYTYVATAQAVLARGGIPIFADIDDTFTIAPESIEKQISNKTKAIIAVHMFGNVADMDSILTLAKNHKILVIEDACQAIGAKYKKAHVGSLGHIGCFSFNETKAIYTGQGGMLVSSNKKFYEIAHITRETGFIDGNMQNDVISTGHTYGMTQMQAVLGRSILEQLDDLNEQRRKNYHFFTQLIDTKTLPLRWFRILPEASPSFYRLVFMIDFQKLNVNRKIFIERLRSQGIPIKTFYPTPLYAYSLFKNKKDGLTHSSFPFSLSKQRYANIKLPFVETFCKQQIGIPFSPYLTDRHIEYFCEVLNSQIRLCLKRSP